MFLDNLDTLRMLYACMPTVLIMDIFKAHSSLLWTFAPMLWVQNIT